MNAKVTEKLELAAQERHVIGQKVKGLRAEGLIPAVLYGRGMDSLNIQIPVEVLDTVYQKAGESTLIYVTVGQETHPTIIAEVSTHPVSGAYIHADFQKVRLDEKVTAEVLLVYVGESDAVKNFNGVLVRNISEVEVEALPQDLPHEIEVDLSVLKNIDEHISISDLKLEKAKIIGHEPDDIIVTVQEPKSQEALDAELAAPTSDVSAVEEVKKETPAEDETPDEKAKE
jgi:large subunit ribosomal protein L25